MTIEMVEFENFFNLTSELMCVLDMDGRCLNVNPAFAAVLGYSADKRQGRLLTEPIYPADRTVQQTKLEQLIAAQIGAKLSAPSGRERSPSSIHLSGRYACQSGEWK